MLFCVQSSFLFGDNMNIKVRKVGETYWLIDYDQPAWTYKEPLKINETGYIIWQNLISGKSVDEISDIISNEYDIDSKTAKEDVKLFCESLYKKGFGSEQNLNN